MTSTFDGKHTSTSQPIVVTVYAGKCVWETERARQRAAELWGQTI